MDQLHPSRSLKMLTNVNIDGGGLISLANGAWPDEAVREINSWSNKESRGLILTIVDNEMSQDAVIVLANALYFKVIWSTPFYANSTKSEFSYGSLEDFKILQIRYESEEQSNKFFMYIFLPERPDGLRNLLEVFHSNHALFMESLNFIIGNWMRYGYPS
ncbi:hypothetical protein CTI12_AA125480 [Artemisia annua]|uniref:Serpin domain-containing protein n=1 Tax=Artemisia annua TaxID=35608 RepID=A0A2U1PQM9_ARTAN|nr:hypothetical protein CTI12_AA125480 [Artemisia annua]